MKTKHLFLATALMASFAACTNEEIVSDVQQNVSTGRPTVENVKLTFGEGVESRLEYNKGWKWEATDQIGALLMDNVSDLTELVWQEKYTLTPYIHTSYPFSYNVEEETWGTPGKMLEGNYFFAYPWESYEGQRQVAHSLINQKQTGITADVRAKSYADNQFFIGYDRIIAGTQDAEALDNVSMTSVLGAIELRLVNTGTQTYNINKVVLSGDKLASQLTFDPAEYEYLKETPFNSANYLDLDEEKGYWSLDELKKYDRDEALRAVVKPVADEINDNFAQIIIEGEDRELLPDAENTAYILIMANPFEVEDEEELYLSIFTDEGYVSGIDLGKINKSKSKYGYITDAKIEEVHPEVKNVIEVQLDDNAFETPEDMEIFNTQDLEQFILWNSKISGKRDITATLNKNVELTEAAYEALIGKSNLKLTIKGEKVLTLAAELPADALDADNLVLSATSTPSVKVLGEIELTKNSVKPAYIEVAEGAELIINDSQVKKASIVNFGTLTIGKNGNLNTQSTIENNGLMTVAAGANIKAKTTNNKEIELAGDLDNVVENAEEAEITMEEGATMGVTTNNGNINTEDEVELTVGTNAGYIAFVEGADVTVGTENGFTAREVSGPVANESTDPASPVNTWIVTKDASFAADAAIKHMIVKDGADIEVAKNKMLSVENMTIKGSTTTEGVIKVGNETTYGTFIVEEDGDLTNDGKIEVVGTFKNFGFIDSNDEIKVNTPEGCEVLEGEYKGDVEFNEGVTSLEEAFETALDEAVVAYIENGSGARNKTWSNVTFDVIKTGYGVWTATDWAGKASKKVIDAYNELKADEDEDWENLEVEAESMQTILAAYEAEVKACIAAAKTEAEAAVATAITEAIANKDLQVTWKDDNGYAYTGTFSDYKAMWSQYANYIKTNLGKWAVEGEYIYTVDETKNGNLINSLALTINSVVANLASVAPTAPAWAIPAGSYIDASDRTAANYVVISAYVNNEKTLAETDCLASIVAWVNGLADKVTKETASATESAVYASISSHISAVANWKGATYSDENLKALFPMVKAVEVENLTELNAALEGDAAVIDLGGNIINLGNNVLTVSRSVAIKNGTLEGRTVRVGNTYSKRIDANVTFDGVYFKDVELTNVDGGSFDSSLITYTDGDVTVVNCTFDGFLYDALQIVNPAKTVVVKNNKFVTPTADKTAVETYLHISQDNKFNAVVLVEGNQFGKVDGLDDYAIKINGPEKFSQIKAGRNTFANTKAEIVAKPLNGIMVSLGDDDADGAVKYDQTEAYDAFAGSSVVTLED